MSDRPPISADVSTTAPSRNGWSAVEELLREAYSETGSLLRLVKSIDERVAQEIVQGPVSYAVVAADVVEKFGHHGRVPELIRALVADRPTLRDTAMRTAGALGLEIDWTAVRADPVRLRQLKAELSISTRDVLEWQSRLPDGASIRRPQFEQLKRRLEDTDARVTALLGEAGSGKSALLATLGEELRVQGVALVGVRLDRLPKDVTKPKKFQEYLKLSAPLPEAVSTLAADGPVVVLLDQFDALCDLMTDRVKRLDLILQTVAALAEIPNVHVIIACRPHEFGHDIRLHRVDPAPITLELPEWPEVEPHVVAAGVLPETLSAELREELRRPIVLHTFLTLLKQQFDASQLTTYQAMRSKLWDLHVRDAKHLSRKEALFALARWIAVREEPLRPVGQMDQYRNELRLLASAGWIAFVEPEQVGFRHQSFFDFALAQYFIESEQPLLDIVLQQQGMWIRRRVWTTLSYLREGHSSQYRKEFESLWQAPRLRRHLRVLLINFLGQVSGPQTFEVLRMREALRSAELAVYAWRAVGRGRQWFSHLCEREVPAQMGDAEDSRRVYGLLYRAIRDEPEKVLGLVEAHWTASRGRAEQGARLVGELPELSETAKRVSCKLAAILGLYPETFALGAMVVALCELDAAAGFAALRQALDVTIEGLLAPSLGDESPGEGRDDTHRRCKETVRDLLEEHSLLSQLESVIEGHPAEFLAAVMPPLERALAAVAEDYWGSEVYKYTLTWPYEAYHNQHTLITCAKGAVCALAKRDVDAFADFLRLQAASEFATIHHLLLRGLKVAAESRPDLLIEYLRGDPRRLNVGGLDTNGAGTIDLLRKVGVTLPSEYQQALAGLIRAWTPVESKGDGTDAEIRRHRMKHRRAHRLNLLLCLDRERLDAATRMFIEEERRAIPEEVTERMKRRPRGFACVVESSMSADNMKKASDDDILAFFAERPDSMDWSHPEHFERGGSIEASRELEKLAKADPLRGLRIASRLPAGTHERPIGMVFEAVAETELDTQLLLDFFWECEARGVRSVMYRGTAARGLEKLVHRDKSIRLPEWVLERLREWLTEESYERGEAWDLPEWRADRAIIYHQFGLGRPIPHGSYSILSCLFAGLLVRDDPDWEGWLAVVAEHLKREDSPRVWQSLSRMIVWVVRADKERASAFLIRLFDKYPELLDETSGLQLLDQLQPHIDHSVTRGWIEAVATRGDDWHVQAFGELLVLRAWRLPEDPWAVGELGRLLAEVPSSIVACRGVALMTAELLREGPLESTAFGRLLALAREDDPSISAAFRHAVWAMMSRKAGAEGEALLRCLHEHPQHIDPDHVHNLIEMMGTYVGDYPGVVVDVCEALLERTRGRAPDLLDFIVTIQDLDGFLERGLDLFERACDLEMFGIDGILDDHGDLVPPSAGRHRRPQRPRQKAKTGG